MQQRGQRPVIRPAAEQLRVPAFGRREIGSEQRGVGLWEVHGSSQAGGLWTWAASCVKGAKERMGRIADRRARSAGALSALGR
jgi:hypothetical protein